MQIKAEIVLEFIVVGIGFVEHILYVVGIFVKIAEATAEEFELEVVNNGEGLACTGSLCCLYAKGKFAVGRNVKIN